MLTALMLASTVAMGSGGGDLPISLDELDAKLQSLHLTDQRFRSTYTVTGTMRTPGEDWDPQAWFFREHVEVIGDAPSLRANIRSERRDETTGFEPVAAGGQIIIWDGRTFTRKVSSPGEAFLTFSDDGRQTASFSPYVREFNLISRTFLGTLISDALHSVAHDTVVDHRYQDGVLTLRLQDHTASIIQRELSVQLEPSFQLMSFTTEVSDTQSGEPFDPERIRHHHVLRYSDWMELDGTLLPGRMINEGRFLMLDGPHVGQMRESRVEYVRDSLERLEEVDPEVWTVPVLPHASVDDQRHGVQYDLGRRRLRLGEVTYFLTEPILHPPLRPADQLRLIAGAQINSRHHRDLSLRYRFTPDLRDRDRPGHELLAELQQVVRASDADSLARRTELIGRLVEVEPQASELFGLLPLRWSQHWRDDGIDIDTEAKPVIEAQPDQGDYVNEAAYWSVARRFTVESFDADGATEAVEQFIEAHRGDPRGARLLMMLALRHPDADTSKAARQRLARDFPHTSEGQDVHSAIRMTEGVGEAFDIAFTDAITGVEITSDDLLGRPVVVYFWATWCGPCRPVMQKLVELREPYGKRGAEFIGINMDGDARRAVDYCREHGMNWPQYVEPGAAFDHPIAERWGVSGIPHLLLIDHHGRVVDTNVSFNLLGLHIDRLLREAGLD
jgi:thiol-disulfide isomerase/thioredoxin